MSWTPAGYIYPSGGSPGPIGPTGPPGGQGPTGLQGPTGGQGPTGAAGAIENPYPGTLTVEVLNATSSMSVTGYMVLNSSGIVPVTAGQLALGTSTYPFLSGNINTVTSLDITTTALNTGSVACPNSSLGVYVDGESNPVVCVQATGLVPYSSGGADIGSPFLLFQAIYAIDGTIQTSDASLKSDISPLTDGLAFIRQLKPVSWRWSDPSKDQRVHLGFLAQDVRKALGSSDYMMHTVGPSGTEFLNYSHFHGPIVQAIQDVDERVTQLEAKGRASSTGPVEAKSTDRKSISTLSSQMQDLLVSNARLSARITLIESKLASMQLAKACDDNSSILSVERDGELHA